MPLKYQAKEILEKEPNVLEIPTPITICSKINGQFLDLLEIFKIAGIPPNTNYLFLGSYVNRGYYSVECILLLLCLKVLYPKRIYLTRGFFDGRQISYHYGFYDECMTKYGNSKVFNYILDTFDFFPLAAKIENKIFCVHGGLTPEIKTVDDINNLDRIQENLNMVLWWNYYGMNLLTVLDGDNPLMDQDIILVMIYPKNLTFYTILNIW